ncbi:hypothetical protein KOW79_016476 [Hemibagrus wyckioides]|uniref:Uncharacterized protein n=1 Tax=Hemibagrus wyckioides TaxID=337641 RepID=A0A9D3NG14_9TELE|nr:hypothetical protein KOW79_016476 [Hemibagrus wyckioides]
MTEKGVISSRAGKAGSVSFRRFETSFLQHIRSGEYCFGPGLHSRLLQWTLIQVEWMHLDVCHACSGWYVSVFGIARLCSQ